MHREEVPFFIEQQFIQLGVNLPFDAELRRDVLNDPLQDVGPSAVERP